jgi:hypothetical protein
MRGDMIHLRENFEIGRFLHLKSEIRKLELDCRRLSTCVQFEIRISDLRCRNRPISNFPALK